MNVLKTLAQLYREHYFVTNIMTTTSLEPLPDLGSYRQTLQRELRLGSPLPTAAFSQENSINHLPAPIHAGEDSGRWPWCVPPDQNSTRYPTNCPDLFIAMPSYNQGRYIEAAIRSVLLQNYPKLTFVIFDGNSTDETRMVLDRYRDFCSFVQIGPDRGQGHAINMAFALAEDTGLRGWLNSDDLYLPNAFRHLANLYVTDTNVDFIYGNGIQIDANCTTFTPQLAGVPHKAFRRYPGAIFSHSAFWSPRVHLPIWEALHCALDYELWVRMIPRCRRIRYLPYPLGAIRVHEEAKTHNPSQAAAWKRDETLNGKAHRNLYGPDPIRKRIHRMINLMFRYVRSSTADLNAVETLQAAGWQTETNRA